MFKNATYIISQVDPKKSLIDKPLFLLLGRSNVGKSTFINKLCNRKSLARVSNNPGKTIAMNYYLIDDNFYIIDVPGYGYARRSFKQRDEFIEMITNYIYLLEFTKIFLLIDFKVGFTTDDLEMIQFLLENKRNFEIIFTKYDKIKSSHRLKQVRELKVKLLTLSHPLEIKSHLSSQELPYTYESIREHIYQLYHDDQVLKK